MATREPTPQDYRDIDAALVCISRSLDAVHHLIAPLTGMGSPVEGRVRTAREKVDGARELLRQQASGGSERCTLNLFGDPFCRCTSCAALDRPVDRECKNPFCAVGFHSHARGADCR